MWGVYEVNTLAKVVSKHFEKYSGEINRLSLALAEANKAKERLEGELLDSIALGNELRDSLNREVASRSKFLKFEVGKVYLAALAKAAHLYDQTI
ncbi:UNVERIFIED_CONTAM: hypothetical protein Sradi_3278700 [Sesamum radiatum]|uniref:Uncharacterized protein n=1 Tax=Sesamum radiatum TaxID=300843 RepID=A0AAW2R0X7_SESRA